MFQGAKVQSISDRKLHQLLISFFDRQSLEEMAKSKTTVLEDIPECKEGEADEKTKSSSNIRDQGDEAVTVNLKDKSLNNFLRFPFSLRKQL